MTQKYLRNEIREGFYLSGEVKKSLNANVRLLEVMKEVCWRNKIRWYAGFGTLLGAVRHHGFIPWDDDLDLYVPREDFNRLCAIAPREFPEGFVINAMRSEGSDGWISCLSSSRVVINVASDYLNWTDQFPYAIIADLYPLDIISDNKEEEDWRDATIDTPLETVQKLDLFRRNADNLKLLRGKGWDPLRKDLHGDGITCGDLERISSVSAEAEELLRLTELCRIETGCTVDRNVPISDQMRLILEGLFSYFHEDEGSNVAFMPFWINSRRSMPKDYFGKAIWLPFENMELPVPAEYEKVLRINYGDYWKIVRGTSTHNYPACEDYVPEFERLLHKMGSRTTFHYQFQKQDLLERDSKQTPKSIADHCLTLILHLEELLPEAIREGNIRKAVDLLSSAQRVAEELGTLLETVGGAGRIRRESVAGVIPRIQNYCEELYQLYRAVLGEIPLNSGLLQETGASLEVLVHSVQKEYLERKEIIFLVSDAQSWETLQPIWKAACEDPQQDVFVIAVPYYYKRADGSLITREGEKNCGRLPTGVQSEFERLPSSAGALHFTEYSIQQLAARHPDLIYFDNAYDQYDQVASVDPFWYSENLFRYTDELVYVQPFEVDEIRDRNSLDYQVAKGYICLPGVVHADECLVKPSSMADIYREILADFCGPETEEVWKDRIHGEGVPCLERLKKEGDHLQIPDGWEPLIQRPDGSRKKVVLYYTDIVFLLGHRDKAIERIRRVLAVFHEKRDDIALVWQESPLIRERLPRLAPDLWNDFKQLAESVRNDNWTICGLQEDPEKEVSFCDAYYGDWSSAVELFRQMGKPVMIQNPEIMP